VSSPATRRFLEFERCFNFRDVGGYETEDGHRVRCGKLFRSMTPEYMTAEDMEAARRLDLRLVVDLRGRHFKTSGPLAESPARRVAVGLRRQHPQTRIALDGFMNAAPEAALPRVLDVWGRTFARALSVIALEDGPVLVHCRLGKDRTGVFSALVLKLVGVPDQTVIEDYLLSAATLAEAQRLMAELGEQNPQAQESRVAAEPPTRGGIETVLQRIETEFGGARGYFRGYGVSGKKLDAFIGAMLER
jgi:protein-tyrosine phosphatase